MPDYESGVYAPSYYNFFRCIADRCRHSCCTDWEICIDDTTYSKFERMGDILPTVEECDGERCFRLGDNGRCPHLNDAGLCDIIINHGEGCLPDICKNHPRFFNYIGSRVEAGLGIVCEEACRLIFENDAPFSLERIDEYCEATDAPDYDITENRNRIFDIIEANADFDKAVAELTAAFRLPQIRAENGWLERLLALEILDGQWERDLRLAVGRMACLRSGYDAYYERLLSYFVYRHVSIADCEQNLRARLAFCVLSVEIIRALFCIIGENSLESLMDFARRYSAEIEYSEDNSAELIFVFESSLMRGDNDV